MIDNVMRLREPAAWVLVGVTGVSILLALTRFVLALTTAGTPLSEASQDVALQAMSLTLVVVLVALVLACVFVPPVVQARRLVAAAAVVVTIGTLVTIVGSLLGLSASAGAMAVVLELLGGLLDIIVKIIGAVTLWLILRGLRAGRIAAGSPSGARPEAGADASVSPVEASAPAPTWTPDTAAGSVWLTASDAASGARPDGQGGSIETGGWHPVVRGGEPAQAPVDEAEEHD